MLRKTILTLTTAVAFAAPAFAGGSAKDIVDTAAAAGSFETLLAAATAAGLVDTLKSEGPFTVFAPTDEAMGMGRCAPEPISSAIGIPAAWPAMSQQAISIGLFAQR